MSDKQLQNKLNQLSKLANELCDEAKARYGDSGGLFFESGGQFHLMSADANTDAEYADVGARQAHIQFSSNGYCRMGSGAW